MAAGATGWNVAGVAADPASPELGRGLEAWVNRIAACPWQTHVGIHVDGPGAKAKRLYTPAERVRRDQSPWTIVQGVLAPVQFLAFLVSLVLVLRYLGSGDGYGPATASVVVKTMLLYAIMITGSIWEKAVFGRWLFAPAFFWEDVFSFLVLALHTAYLWMVLAGIGTPREQMLLALAAYATYAVNATQFLLKLRAARLEAPARGAVAASA